MQINSTQADSVSISLNLPHKTSASTHVYLMAKSSTSAPIKQIFAIVNKNLYIVRGLKHNTVYNITAALGDGVEFGNETAHTKIKTKGIAFFW